MAHIDRAIPHRLITHLFMRMPLEDAEGAINRLVEAALPGPAGWYRSHVRQELERVRMILIGKADGGDCGCMPDAPALTCDVGQALFRVSGGLKSDKR